MPPTTGSRPERIAGLAIHWWHWLALLLLVAVVEAGRQLLAGAAPVEALVTLPQSLYAWCPIVAGVAIAIRRADASSSRAAVGIGIATVLFMATLDVSEAPVPATRTEAGFRTTGGLALRGSGDTEYSWILTGLSWMKGELQGVGERVEQGTDSVQATRYLLAHPRRRAAEALQDGSQILIVFGILGLVLATARWIRGHAHFERPEDERAAHLVVAWLLSSMVVGLVLPVTEDMRFQALFGDGPLWAIPLPAATVLALGVYAWIAAARRRPERYPGEPEGR